MFAIRVRVSPWRLRWKPSSSGRSTRTMPPSFTKRMSACIVCVSEPRGPFTVTTLPSTIVTSTPVGISIGCFPIRLILALRSAPFPVAPSSPHVCEHFATDAPSRGVAVGHDPLRGGHDGDTEPTEHTRKPVAPRVHATARRRDPAQAGDRALTALAVLESYTERLLHPLALSGEPVDVAFGGQDPEHRLVQLRHPRDQVVLVRKVGVADPREQIGDRIRDVARELLRGAHHDDFVTPGNSPMCAS